MSGTLNLDMPRIDPGECVCPDCAGRLDIEMFEADNVDITGWISWRCRRCGQRYIGRFDAEITGMTMFYIGDEDGEPILNFRLKRAAMPTKKRTTAKRKTATKRKTGARR